MKPSPLSLLPLLFGAAFVPLHAQEASAPGAKGKPITEVAHFQDYQVTGIAVSKTGRLFANFPHWQNEYKYAVAEVTPGSSELKPFPDGDWNSYHEKDTDTAGKFVCVQSVYVDDTDALWVLDAGNIMMQGVVAGAPKLVKIDLGTNKVVQTIPFGTDIAPSKSYLNDIRVDTGRNVAYITESGVGCIIVVDLKSGKARRTLVEDASTVYDKKISLTINGKEVMTADKQKPKFSADGIALSPDNEYLYYQPLMGDTLYRVATAKLRDENLSKGDLSKAVEKVMTIFPCDGYWMDKGGNLFLSDLRDGAIQKRTPEGKIELVCSDPRIEWPDSFAMGPDGALYFSCSHIHHAPQYNGGKSARTMPYAIYKVTP